MKVNITAVISTSQYNNIQPSIEVEADSFEEAEKLVMPHIEHLSAKYGEEGKTIVARGTTVQRKKLVSPIGGGYAFYDEANHTYVDSNGKKYVSGSEFAEKFKTPFPAEMAAKNCEKKYDLKQQQILDLWNIKGDSASGFGTAMHAALECYGKYGANAGENALPKHPFMRKVVLDFFNGRDAENALYEPFIVDMNTLKCGQIDRLLIVDKNKKICRVQDYKFTEAIREESPNKKLKAPFDTLPPCELSKYQLQGSFYSSILQSLGWTVEGIDIHNWVDGWETISLPVLEIN